jgi:hypothetical protein
MSVWNEADGGRWRWHSPNRLTEANPEQTTHATRKQMQSRGNTSAKYGAQSGAAGRLTEKEEKKQRQSDARQS